MTNFIEEGTLNEEEIPFVCTLIPVRSGAPDVTPDSNVRELNYSITAGGLTAADVNDRHFGVVYSVDGDAGSVHVESIKVDVVYTLGEAEAEESPPSVQGADENTYLDALIDKSTGNMIIVGGNGRILVSTDGGQNFVDKTSNTVSVLTAIVKTSDGYTAVGLNGTFLRSTDGGQTWARVVTPDLTNLYYVQYSPIARNVVFGGDGDNHVVSVDYDSNIRFRYNLSAIQ